MDPHFKDGEKNKIIKIQKKNSKRKIQKKIQKKSKCESEVVCTWGATPKMKKMK